jgi:hypothetical protein
MDKTSRAGARSKPAVETLLAKPVRQIPAGSLAALRRKARDCHACGLWKHATQTVFGAGADDARIMLIADWRTARFAGGCAGTAVRGAGRGIARSCARGRARRSQLAVADQHGKAFQIRAARQAQVAQARQYTPNAQSEEPRGMEKGIADADRKVRTGSTDEPVRNTPPAGPWHDTAAD